MKKMSYVDETTFEQSEVLVDDLQFQIARSIQNVLTKIDVPTSEERYVSIMPLIARKNGDLITGYLTRKTRGVDIDADIYRIVIEKVA
jgi:hypothetical protein